MAAAVSLAHLGAVQPEDAATQVGQMAMPGLQYHPLKGGRHSVWVVENYRVTFSFQGGHACEVDYEDYH